MATSSYYKAAEWVKGIKISQIESLEWLSNLTIRQLRAIADKINHQNNGWVFCTATLGKPLSRLVKSELAVVIWDFINLKRQAPKTKYFEIDECGNVRIVTERPGTDASPWTVNIGFNSYKEAETLQKFLHTNGHCNASVIRREHRCLGWKYELKVWLLSPAALKAIISKENKKLNAERKPKNWHEELKLAADAYKLSVFQPNFVNQSARVTKNSSVIGAVGLGMMGYWYNSRPSSAASRNMPAKSMDEAVSKLMVIHAQSMEAAIAR